MYYGPRGNNGGDFPSGEIGFGPKKGSVNGEIVYDVKIQHIGKINKLKIKVQNDKITAINGLRKPDFIKILDRDEILYYISEISMGINPMTTIKNDIYIVEEKKLGTMHFGHGANLSYGHRIGLHMDGVIAKPTLKIGNKIIIRNGELNSNFFLKSFVIPEII